MPARSDRSKPHVRRKSAPKEGRARARAEPSVVDEYLRGLPAEQRKALQSLRRTVASLVPRAEECLSYRLPAFRLDGKVLVLFGASKDHCTFFPGSGTAVAALADELEGYDTSKGAIRFQPARPLPTALVKKVVRHRMAENSAPSKPRARREAGRGSDAPARSRARRRSARR